VARDFPFAANLFELFLKHGADPDERAFDGLTVLERVLEQQGDWQTRYARVTSIAERNRIRLGPELERLSNVVRLAKELKKKDPMDPSDPSDPISAQKEESHSVARRPAKKRRRESPRQSQGSPRGTTNQQNEDSQHNAGPTLSDSGSSRSRSESGSGSASASDDDSVSDVEIEEQNLDQKNDRNGDRKTDLDIDKLFALLQPLGESSLSAPLNRTRTKLEEAKWPSFRTRPAELDRWIDDVATATTTEAPKPAIPTPEPTPETFSLEIVEQSSNNSNITSDSVTTLPTQPSVSVGVSSSV
jgi:hypothetical protein